MVRDGDAGGGGLGVVHEHIDGAELGHRRVDHLLDRGLVVLPRGDVGLHPQAPDAVIGLQARLGLLELGRVAAGDHDVGTLLGEGGGDAVTDGAAAFPIA